jgi:benzoyl-CoA reductase/2-hydroxyglutaryl-CoA dehydratase subunit BcrC/BadD/HgdB
MKDLLQDVIDINKNKIELLKSTNKSKIGWFSIYTPEEIIYAAGLTPFRITGESRMSTSDASALLHPNICSYVLGCLSEGLHNIYDFIDGIIVVDACDARRRLYDVWSHFLKPGFGHFIDLPSHINSLSKDYFRKQIHGLSKAIENHFNCKITGESLNEAISLCNETRRLLNRMYEHRKSGAPRITGSDAINIVKSGMSGFKEEFNEKLARLLSEIESKKRDENGKKHRVMICGSYFDHSNIVDIIEKFGATVVCEDISYGVKYFNGQIHPQADPLDALADYYFERGTCARMVDTDRRIAHILNLVEEYNIESVIYFSLKFCDNNLMDFPFIQQELLHRHIPVLFLEGELHMSNIENIKTRIQTFLESVA